MGETLVDSATGRPGPARVRRSRGWFTVVAGDLVVTTDNDPPAGDAKCTVTVEAVDGLTGAEAWKNPVYSGRKQDDDCQRAFGDRFDGPVLIGAGTRIAATTATDRPQVVDLTTGRTVWRGAERGVPLESDGRTLLVRQYADDGPFTLLDWATGATRWTAPDSGLKGTSASWDCALTGRLAAVQGATGNKPFVQVYDVATGRDLGRYGSWLAGLGEDWVATTHGTPDGLALELVTL